MEDLDTRLTAIVGGGFAGIACAVELARNGRRVVLLEAAKQLGGRARSVDWHGLAIDNGQHLMIGAYHATLDLFRQLGTDHLLERRPLQLRVPGFRLALPRLPAPFHVALGLLFAEGLSLAEKLAAARFMSALQSQGFRLREDQPVSRFLATQPQRVKDKLWHPLCIAALNTPPEQASAQVFCNVLRDSLAAGRAASDAVFNRADLGRLIPLPALERLGVAVRLSAKVEAIQPQGDGFHLAGPDLAATTLVLAVHPARLGELLPVPAPLPDYSWQPIHTLWLRFARPPVFPYPMLGLGDGQAPWAFERNDLAPGVAALVTSAAGPHLAWPPQRLQAEWLKLLAQELGPLPELLDWKAITEKRATFACTPGLPRPGPATAVPGLFLTGDYCHPEYPATLEGAVRSGLECAALIRRPPATRP